MTWGQNGRCINIVDFLDRPEKCISASSLNLASCILSHKRSGVFCSCGAPETCCSASLITQHQPNVNAWHEMWLRWRTGEACRMTKCLDLHLYPAPLPARWQAVHQGPHCEIRYLCGEERVCQSSCSTPEISVCCWLWYNTTHEMLKEQTVIYSHNSAVQKGLPYYAVRRRDWHFRFWIPVCIFIW